MIGNPPLNGALPISKNMAQWSQPWANWLAALWNCIRGWTRTYTVTLEHDFGNIAAQSQGTQTVTVAGAAVGDAVLVRPTTAVNGIILDGTVTAVDTVTVRAVNYSSGGIDPASQVYRVIVFQQ
jgi:hypothetical protein